MVISYLDNSQVNLGSNSLEVLSQVTPSLEIRMTDGIMSKAMYDTAVGFSHDSLAKVIRIVGLLLGNKSKARKELPLTAEESHINCFLLLIRSSQAHYPPKIEDNMHHNQVVGTKYGVVCSSRASSNLRKMAAGICQLAARGANTLIYSCQFNCSCLPVNTLCA